MRIRYIKHTVDVALFAVVMGLMSHQLMENALHEWIGIAALLLVAIHIVLNRRQMLALFKGGPSAAKVLTATVDVVLAVSYLVTMVTGAAMSSYAVPFLFGIVPVMSAQAIHLAGSYWSMVLVGLHIGMHWRPVVRAIIGGRKAMGSILLAAGIALTVFGLVAFLQNGVASYLTASTPFAHFDYGKHPLLVIAENAAMIGLFAGISFWIMELIRRKKGRAA